MNDDQLRRVAEAAHDETVRTTDSVADLAAVHRRIARGEIGHSVEQVGHLSLARRRRWMLPTIAAMIAMAVAGLAVVVGAPDGPDLLRTSDTTVKTSDSVSTVSTISTAPSTVLTTPTTSTAPSTVLATPTTSTAPSTVLTTPTTSTAPSTVLTTPTTSTAPSTVLTTPMPDAVEPLAAATISVNAADPPPLVIPEPLVAIPIAPNPDGSPISVAIGPTSIAVRQPATHVVTLIDYGADVDAAGSVRDVGLDEPLHSIVMGPGDILYGFGDTAIPASGGMPDAFRYVAIALSGDRTGQVVAERDLSPVRYLELPPGAFGHGPYGVIDRSRDVNTTVIDYVDTDGNRIEWSDPAPPMLTFRPDLKAGGRVSVVGSDLVWDLAITKSPDTGGTFVGPSPPAPTSRDRVIYSDAIGPDLNPEQDYGPRATLVVAILEPDGSGRWIRIPDDWSVAASDVWGTVLMRTTDDSIELALLDNAVLR